MESNPQPKVECATTVNLLYHRRYGHRLLETFLKHVDPSIPLAYYYEAAVEGGNPQAAYGFPTSKRICPRDLYTDTNFSLYLADATPRVEAKIGPVSTDPDKRTGTGRAVRYNYNWDALTFGRKGHAFIGAARAAQARYLFWLDADIIFHQPMPEKVFTDLFSNGAELVYFGRRAPHTETGFFGVDLGSFNGGKFVADCATYWEGGKVFDMTTGWTDSHVFDAARLATGIKGRSLSLQETGHVMATGRLATYFDHCKGARKQRGHSPERKV